MKKRAAAKKHTAPKKRATAKKHAGPKKHAAAKKHVAVKKHAAAGKTAASKKSASPPMHAKSSAGGAASWDAQPATGVYNSGTNWSSGSVPTTTATFGATTQPVITFAPNSNTAVASIAFAAGAPPYTLTFTQTFNAPPPGTPTLTINGAGVTNGSSSAQSFQIAAYSISSDSPQLAFANSASAGGANVSYTVGPSTAAGPAGGAMTFEDTSTAGAALFTVTTGKGLPPEDGLVGGEVAFNGSSSAGTARFAVYGSTSAVGQPGHIGDTFGTVSFHNSSTAANGIFTNAGGTIAQCDGGNTQFYDTSNAGNGVFHNLGSTCSGANGGDVAIDGNATAQNGAFHNYASTVNGGIGGVTSFNNNAPDVASGGSNAGNGFFFNYGAAATGQGGGHTHFEPNYGSPTAASGMFFNYGSAVGPVQGKYSSAGYTEFTMSLDNASYTSDAGNGIFWNLPGTASSGQGGSTQFYVESGSGTAGRGPSAANATILNIGALTSGALGGQTTFGQSSGGALAAISSAANAKLVATAGMNGGGPGTILFYPGSTGAAAAVTLAGNGTLDISNYGQATFTLLNLDLGPGNITTSLGTVTPGVVLSGKLSITATQAVFTFNSGPGFSPSASYTILTAPNLGSFTAGQFTGNKVGSALPKFTISGNKLIVTFS